jgi:cell shape-determining protein MreC
MSHPAVLHNITKFFQSNTTFLFIIIIIIIIINIRLLYVSAHNWPSSGTQYKNSEKV